jgi:hypothetical protein
MQAECCVRRIAVNERRRTFEDHFMRWSLALCLLFLAAMPVGGAALADDQQVEQLFFDTCVVSPPTAPARRRPR